MYMEDEDFDSPDSVYLPIWAEWAKDRTMDQRRRNLLRCIVTSLLAAWRRGDPAAFNRVRQYLYKSDFRFDLPTGLTLSEFLGDVEWGGIPLPHWLDEPWPDDGALALEVR